MKKKLGILTTIIFVISLLGIGVTKMQQIDKNEKGKELVIVTAFTPIYVLTSNLVKDISDVKVENLIQVQGECLHDYQLTTEDMKKLEKADVFIMNGGGMEGFIEEIVKTYPDLIVIDSSKEVSMLISESTHIHEEEYTHEESHEHEEEHEHENEESHEHEHEEDNTDNHSHSIYNSHIWLSTKNYRKQIEKITKELITIDSANRVIYQKNANAYLIKVNELEKKFEQAKEKLRGTEVISFHEGFAYIAEQLGIEVVRLLNLDENNGLSAGEMAETIDEIRYHKIENVLVEEENVTLIQDSIGKETGVNVLSIHLLLTGNENLNSYLEGMEQNLEILLQITNSQ